MKRISLSFAIPIMVCGLCFADPPGSNLISVRVHAGGRTQTGYAMYDDKDVYRLKLGFDQVPDKAMIESILRGYDALVLYPQDLKLVEEPSYFYIYAKPPKKFSWGNVSALEITEGPLDGHMPSGSGFFFVDKHLFQLLGHKSEYQCWVKDEERHTGVAVFWVSYNKKFLEKEMAADCGRKTPSEQKPGLWGRHPRFREVYWFSTFVDDC